MNLSSYCPKSHTDNVMMKISQPSQVFQNWSVPHSIYSCFSTYAIMSKNQNLFLPNFTINKTSNSRYYLKLPTKKETKLSMRRHI